VRSSRIEARLVHSSSDFQESGRDWMEQLRAGYHRHVSWESLEERTAGAPTTPQRIGSAILRLIVTSSWAGFDRFSSAWHRPHCSHQAHPRHPATPARDVDRSCSSSHRNDRRTRGSIAGSCTLPPASSDAVPFAHTVMSSAAVDARNIVCVLD
jgi:hypothetical protein